MTNRLDTKATGADWFRWADHRSNSPLKSAKHFAKLMTYTLSQRADDSLGLYIEAKRLNVPATGFCSTQNNDAGWLGHIAVTDLSDASDRWQSAGGAVLAAPQSISHVGRTQLVADPFGAQLYLFQPNSALSSFDPISRLGHVCWYEYISSSQQRPSVFYQQALGWHVSRTRDRDNDYQVIEINQRNVGGFVALKHYAGKAYWLPYFHVHDIHQLCAELTMQSWATVTDQPVLIPNTGYVVQIVDSEKAAVGLFQPL